MPLSPDEALESWGNKMNNDTYKHLSVDFYEEKLDPTMRAGLTHHTGTTGSGWEFTIFSHQSGNSEIVYQGDLRKTIELILLGKLVIEQATTEVGI